MQLVNIANLPGFEVFEYDPVRFSALAAAFFANNLSFSLRCRNFAIMRSLQWAQNLVALVYVSSFSFIIFSISALFKRVNPVVVFLQYAQISTPGVTYGV